MSNDGGPFRGQRERNVDYFDDVMGDNSVPALFDGSIDQSGGGMRNYDGMKVTPTPEGIDVRMHCRACPLENVITLSWPELFIVSHAARSGMLPAGWKRSDVNMGAYPETHCSCRTLCAPIVTPDWAAQKVNAAMQSGLITQEVLLKNQEVQALAQRMRGG